MLSIISHPCCLVSLFWNLYSHILTNKRSEHNNVTSNSQFGDTDISFNFALSISKQVEVIYFEFYNNYLVDIPRLPPHFHPFCHYCLCNFSLRRINFVDFLPNDWDKTSLHDWGRPTIITSYTYDVETGDRSTPEDWRTNVLLVNVNHRFCLQSFVVAVTLWWDPGWLYLSYLSLPPQHGLRVPAEEW